MTSDGRVVVWAPPRDARLTCEFLMASGVTCHPLHSWRDVQDALTESISALIVAGELLTPDVVGQLEDVLAQQPTWSDLPVIVVASGEAAVTNTEFLHGLGNVSVLSRPLALDTLRSTVAAALRARRRQYQVRALLQQREDADRRKDEFLAMLAHELRNPLAPLRTGLQLLHLKPSEEVVDRTYAMMGRQITHITRLVDDLLDVSRLTRGKITLQRRRVDLAESVRQVVETARPALEQKRLDLEVAVPTDLLFVDADPVRLEQIVGNLLSNAIKFTPPGGRICIRGDLSDRRVVLRVQDTGIGIPRDQIPHVFGLFNQTQRSLDRSQGGLGIGLTVVKMLATLHGGSAEIFSNGEQTGTEAIVRLPLAAQHQTVDTPVPRPTQSEVRKQRIVIIEDNQDSAEMLATYLRFVGHEVHLAFDGRSGVQLALSVRPSVVLCDIGLPGMTGYDVAQQLSASDALAGSMLIALTGYGDGTARDRSRRAGFTHHLTKPIDPAALADLVVQGVSAQA